MFNSLRIRLECLLARFLSLGRNIRSTPTPRSRALAGVGRLESEDGEGIASFALEIRELVVDEAASLASEEEGISDLRSERVFEEENRKCSMVSKR